MTRHPGDTAHLIALAGLRPGAKVLDLGAGDGDGVRLLRLLGYDARGVDRKAAPDVEAGDLLRTGFADASFDAVMSECAFFVSGDVPGALRESARLLKQGGTLLLADVFFEDPAPLLEAAGLRLLDRRVAGILSPRALGGRVRCLPGPEGKESILDADRKEGLTWICSTASWS